jgi:hypothetical protein
MMQGLVMGATEPLYGRATEAFHLRPLPAGYLSDALGLGPARDVILAYTAWGGVPRYWELMLESGLPLDRAVDHLGLIQREIPFGAPAASAKRSLYKIADPFCRMWFRVLAPNRGFLADAPARAREKLWREAKQGLVSAAWEELCRQWVPLGAAHHPAFRGTTDWEPARRFWHGEGPEWDVVSQTLDEGCVLLGEVKWSERPVDLPKLRTLAKKLLLKGIPPVKGLRDKEIIHVMFVPEVTQDTPCEIGGVHVITGEQVLHDMR